jgi:hypothetical protein
MSFLKKIWFVVFVLCGCALSRDITVFTASPGVVQVYLPPTKWNEKDLKALLDITYRHQPGSSAVCNISIKTGWRIPPMVSSGALVGDGISYPLKDIKVLFLEKKVLRITTNIAQDDFIALLNAQSVHLSLALSDGSRYQCTPAKIFQEYKDHAAILISYSGTPGE